MHLPDSVICLWAPLGTLGMIRVIGKRVPYHHHHRALEQIYKFVGCSKCRWETCLCSEDFKVILSK